MKLRVSHQKTAALTLVEVLVIIVVLVVLAALLLPALAPTNNGRRPQCILNLKMIGLASLVWAEDHGGKFPMQVSITNWGAKELALTGDVAGIFCTLSNELNTPKYLICPADKGRVAVKDFTGPSAKNISYFVGLDAVPKHPRFFLSGDDNFAIGGVPVKSGLLEFSTNAPITWTDERHDSAGYIGFADGSVMQIIPSSLQQIIMQTGVATNRLAIP